MASRGLKSADGALRLVLIGAGWISTIHLAALDRLARTRLVGVASGREESARAAAEPRGATAYADVDRMLDEERPDAAWVAVPPSAGVAILERLVERRIPFLTEKPLAATDADGPVRIAAGVAEQGLVTAVGYHLRGLEPLREVRELLAADPAHLFSARWLSSTPPPAWWRREELGGGQVVEQATHFYDLARLLVGEATVVGAASTLDDPAVPSDADVVDATAAVLRFDTGAVGVLANSRRIASASIEVELAAPDLLITIRKDDGDQRDWTMVVDDGRSSRTLPPGRDPYEVQAEAFLDAVEAGDPSRVLSSYADALLTDGLTRAVVAATGHSG